MDVSQLPGPVNRSTVKAEESQKGGLRAAFFMARKQFAVTQVSLKCLKTDVELSSGRSRV